MKEFDERALAECDGRDGRPACVAYQGRVYDVSGSPRWKDGLHMRRHQAGRDMGADLGAAPHGPEKLEQFPQVGVVATARPPAGEGLPPALEALLERFPMLRRHPHPMTVHFPIAFAFAAFAFAALQALTGNDPFGATARHCLAAGALTTPVAMITGFAAWRINYLGRPLGAVRAKIVLSALLWADFGAGIALDLGALGVVAVGGIAAVLASGLGWIGGSLTFPVHRS